MIEVNKCCNCESPAIHRHHIVPKSLGGTDRDSNLAWVCEPCHGLIHNQNFLKNKELQRKGIERAKKEGKFKGRKPKAMLKAPVVLEAYESGAKIDEIVDVFNISRASVYRILGKGVPKKHKKHSDPCDDWSKVAKNV